MASGRRPFSLKSAFTPPPPLSPPPHSLAIQQPLAEIRGNIAFGMCVRVNKGEYMLLKKKAYIYIYILHTLIVITSREK